MATLTNITPIDGSSLDNALVTFSATYNDATYSGKVEMAYDTDINFTNPIDLFSTTYNTEYAETSAGKIHTVNGQVRYIRDWLHGSSANTGNHWVEIQAFLSDGTNIALNKTVTLSANATENATNPLSRITDGSTDSNSYADGSSTDENAVYVEIDLGAIYDITDITVWHYYSDGRTYHETKTETSTDATTWNTVFESAIWTENNTPTTDQQTVSKTLILDYNTNYYLRARAINNNGDIGAYTTNTFGVEMSGSRGLYLYENVSIARPEHRGLYLYENVSINRPEHRGVYLYDNILPSQWKPRRFAQYI